MRLKLVAVIAMLASCTAAASEPYHLIPGSVPLSRGPDGNSVILDAPQGLIVVDTGRHPDHVAKILAAVSERGRPIAAIVNTHWHYDHTTGNRELLTAFPAAEVVASRAIDGAMYKDFVAKSRRGAEGHLASGKATAQQEAAIRRGFAAMDDPAALRARRPVDRNGAREIAGRTLDVNLARHAASEGDVWLYDAQSRTAIVGDLVVDIVPFMDTACPEGWTRALDAIAATPFETLIPGHGPAMSKTRFLEWKSAFDRFVACGRSDTPVPACADGWSRDAKSFIPETHRTYAKEAAAYYLGTRFRSAPEERNRFCNES